MVKITPKQAAGYIIQTIHEYRNELVRAKTFREYLPIEGRQLTDYADRLTAVLKTPDIDKKLFEKLNIAGLQELLNLSAEIARNFQLAIYATMKGAQVASGQEVFYIRNAQFYVDGRNSGLTVSELYQNLFQIDYYTDTEQVKRLNLLLGFTDSKINYGEYKKNLSNRVNEPKFVGIMREKHLQEREDPVQGAKFLRYFDAEHGTNILHVTNELDRKVEEVRSDLEKLDFAKAVDILFRFCAITGMEIGNMFGIDKGMPPNEIISTLVKFLAINKKLPELSTETLKERIRNDNELQNTLAASGLTSWVELLEKIHPENLDNFVLQDHEITALVKTIGIWLDKNKQNIDRRFETLYNQMKIGASQLTNNFFINDGTAYAMVNKLFPALQELVGFTYAGKKEDFYYTHEKSIQSKFGFPDYYDEVAGYLGMDLDDAVVTYRYGLKEYKIEFWRGTYGYGNAYGGEVGIYSRSLAEAIEDPYEQGSERSRFMYFGAVPEGEQLKMILTVFAKIKKREIKFINDTTDRKEITNGTHFWNLAIRTTDKVAKQNIKTESELIVENREQRDALFASLSAHPKLQVSLSSSSVTVIFKDKSYE